MKRAQRVAGKRMIIAAGVYVFELAGLVIAALGIGALEQEALDFIGRVERVAFLLVQLVGEALEHAANVGGVRLPTLVDDVAEDQHLARTEDIRRPPVEGAPVDTQPQIALPLRGKAANRGAVEGQVVPALQQELLVVVQHVQPAFQVAEQHRHRLDSLLVGEIFQALLLNLADINAVEPVRFGAQVHLFQFVVRKREEITQFRRHATPYLKRISATSRHVVTVVYDWTGCKGLPLRLQGLRLSNPEENLDGAHSGNLCALSQVSVIRFSPLAIRFSPFARHADAPPRLSS